MTKKGHLPTGHGPTLPIPRRGDLQDRRRGEGASGTVGSGTMGGGRCGPTDGAPLATEIAPSLERDTPLPTEQKMLGDVYCNTRLESTEH